MFGKIAKIILVLLILVGAGYFLIAKLDSFSGDRSGEELAAMKEALLAPAEVKNATLNEEQKNKFLADLKTAQDQVLKLNFDTLQGVNEVARFKMLLGDFEGARVAWEYANIIRPKNSLSFANLAALYHFDLKNFEKAEKNYLIAIANEPDDIPTIRNLFELYYFSLKDNSKAESLLLNSIEQNPKAQDLYSLAGRFYVETDKPEKGLEYYQKHLGLNPDNAAVRKEVDRLRVELKQ